MIELQAYIANMLDILTVSPIDIKQELNKLRTTHHNLLITKCKKDIYESMLLFYLI